MSPTLTTFLFEAANFLVLAGVLGWLFFKPVRAAIERRRFALQQQADETAVRLADADHTRSEIAERFASLERELEERRQQSLAGTEQQAEQILTTARDFAQRETEAARYRLSHLEQGQRERLARIIAETTATAVDRLLRRIGQPELDHALTAAACREIEAFDGNSLAPVRIESSRLLDKSDRQILLAALGPAGETAEFHVSEDLGTGLRVATNRGLVDVSSAGLSTFAARLLARELASGDDAGAEEAADV